MFSISNFITGFGRGFHTTAVSNHIIHLSRLRVVDNSKIGMQAMLEGRPPKCIHVYNKTSVGTIGDLILVAIKGEKKKAIIVGCRQKQNDFIPRFDSNNIVLIDDTGTPIGKRILVPIPYLLRTRLKAKNVKKGVDFTKLLALATHFV
ncbi:UNVERIFIED_CONTAM: hypothetical protein PYX00_008653 [Menopon gallinae]|uniref:Large ribosomal subunit protein uL14m n=1 Tax=Menopon gallinae TaxID=328185 RepID=A0AAW2HQ92_9NEOP